MIGAHQLAPPQPPPLFTARPSGGMPRNRMGQRRMYRAQTAPEARQSHCFIHRKNLAPTRTQKTRSRSVVHASAMRNVGTKPFDQIMQHSRADPANILRNARGVILKAGHIMPRQIEYPRSTLLVASASGTPLESGYPRLGSPARRPWPSLAPRGNHGNGRATDLLGRGAQTVENGRTPLTGGERCQKLR